MKFLSNMPDTLTKSEFLSYYNILLDLLKKLQSKDRELMKQITKGDKGEKGTDGRDGTHGRDGKDGRQGERGERGERGRDGVDGRNGNDGEKGERGEAGKDGSPDTPQQIADKLNILKEQVEIKVIKDLRKELDELREQKKRIVYSGGNVSVEYGLSLPIISKATDYSLTAGDFTVLVDANTGNKTITLPDATSVKNRIYNIKKIDSSANQVIIDASGTQTIDGDLTVILLNQYTSVTVQSDGANWVII